MQKRQIKKISSPILRILLKTVALAGIAGVVIVAPNALQAIDLLIRQNKKYTAKRAKYYVSNSGYFTVKKIDDNRYAITLTNKGSKVAEDVLFDDYTIQKLSAWDGIWRVLMFDISENNRKLRDALRIVLVQKGFKLIQNSVYVYPYPIDEFVVKLHNRYPDSTKHVIRLEATYIEGQDILIKSFKKDKTM